MMCTEYMARPFGSTFEDILPLFREHQIGAYNWGLVEGKSQTHCAWESWNLEKPQEPELWYHDVFRTDGTPYRQQEVDFLRSFLFQRKKAVA